MPGPVQCVYNLTLNRGGQFLVQLDLPLQQPGLAAPTAPGLDAAVLPLKGQVFVHSVFSPTAPMLVPFFCAAHSVLPAQQPDLLSPTAPGATEVDLVELQPLRATTAHTATRLRIDFIGATLLKDFSPRIGRGPRMRGNEWMKEPAKHEA